MKPHIPQVYFCVLSEFVSYTLLVQMEGLKPPAASTQNLPSFIDLHLEIWDSGQC